MDSIRKLRIKHEDGTYSNSIPIGASSDDIFMTSGGTLTDSMSDVEEAIIALDKTNDTQGESINELVKSVSSNTIAIQNQKDVNEKQETKMENFEKALAQEKVYVFDNVYAMKNANNLKAGMYCITKGYYTPNDGGKGEYLIRTKTDNDVDDGGSIHFINNNLVAELLLDINTNVLQFGIKNDGETDISEKLQLLLNANKIKKYYFPAGNYLIRNTITINNTVAFIGCKKPTIQGGSNNDSKIIIDSNKENFTAFSISNGPHPYFQYLFFFSSSFDFSDNRDTVVPGEVSDSLFIETINKENVNCINCMGSSNNVYDCLFYGFSGYAIGIRYSSIYNGNIFFKCKYCYYASYTNNTTNDIIVKNDKCYWIYNYYFSRGGGLVTISDLTLDSCSGYVLDIKNCTQLSFTNSRCDYVLYAYMKADYCSNCTFSNIKGRAGLYYIGFNISDVANEEVGKACEFYFLNNGKGNKINGNFMKKMGTDNQGTANIPATFIVTDGNYYGDSILTIESNSINEATVLDETNIESYICAIAPAKITFNDINQYGFYPIYARKTNKPLRNSFKNNCYCFDMWNLPQPMAKGMMALYTNNAYMSKGTTGVASDDWIQLN